ncbi:TonB-dependent receptor [Sphingomonas sp.]|uniref:TonB-dependent receptor n=1 Tax=Sphingomonas sp. TaxID=28214 RepID=UPI0025D08B98|nr:TonB-dependent receptor [Sphingomonas sp.]
MIQSRHFVGSLICSLLAGASWPAVAQTSTPFPAQPADTVNADAAKSENTQLGDIVVTATRRQQSVQDVPLSITAVTSETLARKAATNFFDYGSSIPNLSFGNTAEGTTGSRTIAIRGIADRNTTGFYIDETPVSESLDPRIVDVSRIEVLRGPQGTLYGARSMGGTVRLITEQPSTTNFEGRVHGAISTTRNTDRPNYQLDGAINIPIVTDKIGLRVVGVHQQDAGYFARVIGPAGGPTTTRDNIGQSLTDGFSVAALLKPTDRLSITPRILYQNTRLNGFPFADVAVAGGTTPDVLKPQSLVQRRTLDVPEASRDKWLLATLDIKYDAGFGSFSSASSYFRRRSSDVEDTTDFITAAFGLGNNPIATVAEIRNQTDSYTQELRFASSFRGPFQVVTGVYVNRNETGRSYPSIIVNGLNARLGGAFGTDLLYKTDTPIVQTEYAAYAEGTYNLTNKLKIIAGLRGFSVKTTSSTISDGIIVGGPTVIPRQSQTQSGVTPKASIQYEFSRGNQIYATAAKGFRPGGVNGVVPTALGCAANLTALGRTPESTRFYDSDSVWSYEVGAKATLLNRRLTANASAFRIDWSNIQQRIQLQCGFGFRGNAGAARSQGVELELNVHPTDNFDLSLGFGYTDAKFTQSSPGTRFAEGDRVPQVPHVTANIGGDYRVTLTDRIGGFLHGDFSYVGSSTSSINANTDANGRLIPRIRPSYELVNLRLGVNFGRSEIALFAKNLTDERANLSDALAVGAEVPGKARVTVNPPRTLGVEFRSRF